MRETALETVADALGLVVEFVAMILLGTVGLLAERAGLATLESGFDPVVIWLLVVGAVALYASVYMIGYRRLLGRLLAA